MIVPIFDLMISALLALFLSVGIISLSLLVFYSKNQRRCRSFITLGAEDTDAELLIRACRRADRLLGRTLPPILIDTGMTEQTQEIVRRLAQRYDFIIISGSSGRIADTCKKHIENTRENNKKNT